MKIIQMAKYVYYNSIYINVNILVGTQQGLVLITPMYANTNFMQAF